MGTSDPTSRSRQYRQDEVDSAAVYRAMASAESHPQPAAVYRRLAETESQHAEFWAEKLRDNGVDVPEIQPTIRARMFAWLAGRFGPGFVLASMRG